MPHGEAPASHLSGGPVPRGEGGPLEFHGDSAGPDGQRAGQEVELPESLSPEDAAAAAVAGGDSLTPSASAALQTSQV